MSPTQAFEMPDLTQVENLMVERLNETTLKPDSPVICFNRGRKPLQVTYNAEHLTVPVGYFRTEYGAAQHMQKHCLVPGTRDPLAGGFVSWVAILGSDDGRVAVDHPDACQPFSDEEMAHFGESIEGLSSEGRDPLVPMRTSVARAAARNQGFGGSLKPVVDVSVQASDAAREAAANVFSPPAESDTRAAEALAANAPADGDEPMPQPRPMRRNR